MNNDTNPQQHIYQQFIDEAIAQTINAIQQDAQLAQSEQGQHLLKQLQDKTSDVYKQAVAEAIQDKIDETQNNPNITQVQQQLLDILRQKRDAEKPQLEVAQIPNEIMLQTIEMITTGKTRIEVATLFIEQKPRPEWLRSLGDMDNTQAIPLLSQRLRIADPTSKRFAQTKYQQHAHAVHAKVQEQFEARIYALIDAQINDFDKTDQDFAQLIEQAKADINAAQENPTEKRQQVKLLMNLQKQRDERANTFLTHFQKILETKRK